ncbi:ATP-grasp domain-containing protein [bacterium]|nr:ATP-grasp domain-containing protein [bacterium]
MKTYKNYLKEAKNVHLAYYLEAADTLKIHYKVLIPGLLAEFRYKDKVWHIINAATPLTNTTSATIAKKKHLTHMVLEESAIPVPKQEKLKSPIDAIKFFAKYKRIVIKPAQQLGGIGITLLPNNEKEVLEAYTIAKAKNKSKSNTEVLGEEFLDGENYRLLVVGDKIEGTVRRKAAHIAGNGKDSIQELINTTNKIRKKNILSPIKIDNEVNVRLRELNMTLDSIPQDGEEVILRYSCNLSTGGTTQECNKEVHPYYKQLAIDAVHAIGTEFGGVDIITPDITKKTKCGINEINYNPGLRLHYKVHDGESVKVAIPIMKYIQQKYLNS